jgi:RNA polymerase sigma-70 factor (ECF subfamily)
VSGHELPVDPRSPFELVYERHAHAVKAYVRRRADTATTDDVLAEVFLVCWRRFEELPPDPLPWLLAVARRVLSTQRRSQRRRSALIDRLAQNAAEPPDVYVSVEDGALAGALAGLGEADRELLLLIAWDGLTPAQAAVVLGAKPATVRVRLLRARQRLDRALALEDAAVRRPCQTTSIGA